MGNLRTLFESDYPGKEVLFNELVKPIFAKAKDTTLTDEQELSDVDKKQIKSFKIFAQVRGGFPVTFADVELNDSVALKRSRVNIQNCVRKVMANDSNAIIFFHFTDSKKEWRVSYVNRGDTLKNSTNAKRYTYLCGADHSCRTIAERFETLQGLSVIKDENMLDAFSVEPLSKDFFEKYREHYADLVEYISGKRFVKKGGKFVEEKTKNANGAFKEVFGGDDKAVRDFVKKMMGRLVFLQFLQKKGWLGVEAGQAWGTGDKNFIYNLFQNASEDVKKDFLEQALEPLFFNSLNNDRGDEAIAPKSVCSIYGKKIRIPYLNGGLFEEDELDKKKVKFKKEHFQDLLEFFNQYNFTIDETDPDDMEIGVDPEMLGKIFENLLEDNKDKGAFYTPKEIVQYMCRESLIAYLLTDSKISEEKIRDFVVNHNCSLNEAEKAEVLKALLDVKICDPAVGSGAFPMGMLNELLSCTQLLTGEGKTRADLKKHIVKNNIYGVDIEKGAVDIARLRFWLAIIVDEETPLPLPNLDYKIMQGNSLLESFENTDLSNLTTKSGSLFDNEDMIAELVKAINGFYIPHDNIAKSKIRAQISENVLMLLKERQIGTEVLNKLKKIDLHENNQFFLWHTWFNDVFNRTNDCNKNGFDIVIGNPPYIDSETMTNVMPELRETYASLYATAKGNWDMFVIFIELGMRLCAINGIYSFIIPNKLIAAKYTETLRKKLETEQLIEIRDYSRLPVFSNAAVYPCTIVCKHSEIEKNNKTKFVVMNELTTAKSKNLISKTIFDTCSYWDVFFRDEVEFNIICKFLSNSVVKEKYTVIGSATVSEAYKIKEILFDKEDIDVDSVKVINTGTIDPYECLWGKKPMQYIKGKYDFPRVKITDLKNMNPKRVEQAKSEKLIIAGMSSQIEAVYDKGNILGGKSTTIVLGNNLKYLLALLSSKLSTFCINILYNSLKMAGGYLNIGTREIEDFPLPNATDETICNLENIVDKIIENKENGTDTKSLEDSLNTIICNAYGLSPSEIQILEKK